MMHNAWSSIERCPIVFQGHPSNFKVTPDKKSPILTQIWRFQTVTPFWIDRWLWNDAQSLKLHRRGALLFLAATQQLYKWFSPSICPTVCLSVCPSRLFSCDQAALRTVISVCLSVRLSVTPFSQCSSHCIIMKFSGVITNDRSDVHTKVQGQRSKVKVKEIMTPFSCFQTITPVWIHIWWWNDAQSLMLLRRGALLFFKAILEFTDGLWNDAQSLKQHRRGALLFFKVIHQISRSHGTKSCRFWPELSISGLQLQFEFTDGFEMMHKAWCG